MKKKGIVIAADICSDTKAMELVATVAPFVEAVKLGAPFLLDFGLHTIESIKTKTKLPIIADVKVCDVPHIARRTASALLNAGADAMTIAAISGTESISECAQVFGSKRVFVFTQFTHMTGLIDDELATAGVDAALSVGCSLIVPATRPDSICSVRERGGPTLRIMSCGVGAQGPPPGTAVAAGSDWEIIGRAIYDPKCAGCQSRRAAANANAGINQRAKSAFQPLDVGAYSNFPLPSNEQD